MIKYIDTEKCQGCGVCAKRCPLDAIRMNDEKKAYIAYPDDCMTCYLCELVCPHGAVYVHPFKEILPWVY
ncbi:MAG: 4Fe-4S dicluster domain-containing protein [Peptococcales bacterium]|jgi:NAD-dependent dihydropyrimidine dehydrogenase PreA subunit